MICFPSKDNCGEDSPLKSSFVLNQLMALLTCLKGGKVWGSAPYYTFLRFLWSSLWVLVFWGLEFLFVFGLKCFIKMSCITPILSKH